MASKSTQCPLYRVVGQGDCDWHYTSQGSIGVAACGTACDAEALCEKFTYGSSLGCRISKCGTNPGGTSCLNGQCPLASGYGGSVYSMDTQLTETECNDWRATATTSSGGTPGGVTLSPPSSYSTYPRGCWEWSSGANFYYNAQPYPHTGSPNANARPVCKRGPTRFAVITATKNAETLPYGPGPIGGDVAYFCTDCIDTLSDSWTETVACDGSNVDMTLVYKFDSAMSVMDRMRQCSATGCNVGFTVSGPGITTISFNSDWWFTDQDVLPSTSGSGIPRGSGVSSDDGMWGGAPGEVNGDGQCYGNTGETGFYGFGNCNAGDSQGVTVYYGPGGSKQCPSLKAQLYVTLN